MAMSSMMIIMPPLLNSMAKTPLLSSIIPSRTRKGKGKAPVVSRFMVRSCSTAETWEGDESDNSVEVAKGPPSIISALNVQKALRGIAITDVDHYAMLGLQRGCAYDLVRAAYENKVEEVSSQGLDDQKLNKQLHLLKESYRILSTEEERRLYDWSVARNQGPERYVWPFEVDLTQTVINKGTPPAQEPENVRPTILVGYFFLGWLVLAFTLSIILNQL